MTVTLTLNAGLGADLGPNFNLTADVGSVTPSTATLAELLAGKNVDVDNTATQVTITSTGTCTNAATLNISGIPTTTTTTTTTTAAPTTTTTTTTTAAPTTTTTTTTTIAPPATSTLSFTWFGNASGASKFTFTLTDALSVDLTINAASVNTFSDFSCTSLDGSASTATSGTISTGQTFVEIDGTSNICPSGYERSGGINITGVGLVTDGQTFNMGGTIVTYSAPNSCEIPLCIS